MALSTKIGNEVPDGALLVSREEALDYQNSVVRNWPTLTDVQVTKIFLKHGSDIAFGTTFVSAVTIFDYFRRAMNVKKKIYTFLLCPTLFIPAYVSSVATKKIVTDNSLLMKLKCPVCNQIKFTLAQCYCGMVFPVMYGLASFTLVGHLTGSYDFRKAAMDPKLYWKQAFEFVKGGTRSYQIAGVLHGILILTLPYMQAKEVLQICKKINESSDELLES